MAQRKYLIFSLTIYFFIVSNLTDAYATAWLPEPGKYIISLNYNKTDKTTRKYQKQRSKFFTFIQNSMVKAGALKAEIIQEAAKQNRKLHNHELRSIEFFDTKIEEGSKYTKEMSAFEDDYYSNADVEYGISPENSFGIKLDYKESHALSKAIKKFSKRSNDKHASFYFKHKLYGYDNIIITLMPKTMFYNRNNGRGAGCFDLSLFSGVSEIRKNFSTYAEFEITGHKFVDKNIKDDVGYSISTQEGIKFNNGFMLSNFTEYEESGFKNKLYKRVLYEQVAIAKELCFDKMQSNCFNVQMGYFWKKSLVDDYYKISGPIISLWLIL